MEKIEKLFGSRNEVKGNCFQCNEPGHFAKDCTKRARSPSPKPQTRSSSSEKRNVRVTRILNQGGALSVPVGINGTLTHAIIDTGADATIISKEVAKKAGLVPDKSESFRLLNATNGSELDAVGAVTATIQLAKRPYKWDFVVAPIRDPVLLGMDFMKAINATIHTGRGTVIVNDDAIISGILTQENEEPYACGIVQAHNGVTEQIMIGRVEGPVPNEQVVIGNTALPKDGQVYVGLLGKPPDAEVREDESEAIYKETNFFQEHRMETDIRSDSCDMAPGSVKKLCNLHSFGNRYAPGDPVHIPKLRPARSKPLELQRLWCYPSMLTKQQGPVCYEVGTNGKTMMTIHHDHLKPFKPDSRQGWDNRFRRELFFDTALLPVKEVEQDIFLVVDRTQILSSGDSNSSALASSGNWNQRAKLDLEDTGQQHTRIVNEQFGLDL
ncbi:hypothetical protein FSP39_007215 [Pinctada imbricata]|uniref:CCHC-type domain-containing protein n=1 Tax=Pinctada imbricata TaxID=66713 RepID=A0AA89C492_PINIB|nr:hypothetical protein FSP39_007215 [Pinctada imbricata]